MRRCREIVPACDGFLAVGFAEGWVGEGDARHVKRRVGNAAKEFARRRSEFVVVVSVAIFGVFGVLVSLAMSTT